MTTNSDTHIGVILIGAQDRLLNFNKFAAPYVRNVHDYIMAYILMDTIGHFSVKP